MAAAALAIRPATIADLDALTATRIALFQELGQFPDGTQTSEFATVCSAQLESMMSSATARAWLGEAPDGSVHAAAILLEYPRIPSPANLRLREGYILNVYVSPAWRRRGIAGTLIGTAIEAARERGLGRIRLHTTPAGRSVYQAHGFEPRDNEMELVL